MDIKKSIEELIEKVKNDPELRDSFMKDPLATVEKLLGVDLPEEQIKQIADGVKAKISLDKIGSFFKK
ncbi:MAG: hypothetical protein HFG26_02305 [Provencibacterium sp.]|jgi:hypothetical protein|nr:hypothetical protein [Provencibacterium sp.]